MEQDFHVDKTLRMGQLKMYFQGHSLNVLCIARFTCGSFLPITTRGVSFNPCALPFVLMYLCLKIITQGGPTPPLHLIYNICYVAQQCTLRASCSYIVRIVRKNNDNVDFLSQFYTLCYHNAIQPCSIFKFLSIFSTTE